MLAVQPRNQAENSFRRLSVQVTRWFIGQQQLGPGDERTGQRNPLLLAARELSRAMMRALLQSNLTQPA